MATDPFDPLLDDGNPFTEGLRRRALAKEAYANREAAPTVDPYAGQWDVETARSQVARVGGYPAAVEVLGRKLAGDQAGTEAAARRYLESEQEASQLGPDIQSFQDARDAGGGVGDYAKAIGYSAAEFVPDMALSLTGAGAGAVGGKTIATGLARRAIRQSIEGSAKTIAMREAAERAAIASVKDVADEGAVRVARAQAREQVDQAVIDRAVRLTGRTPISKEAMRLGTGGARIAGASAGQFPGMATQDVELLSDPNTSAEDAQKIGGVTALASVLGSVPAERFFARFGGQAAKDAVAEGAQKFLPRVAKEFAKQGLVEGSVEVAQEATQRAGHKWVDDNLDLLSPEARDAYLANFLGGFFAGGVLGSSGEVVRGGRDASRAVYENLRGRLQKFANSQRNARQKYQPGDVMEDAPAVKDEQLLARFQKTDNEMAHNADFRARLHNVDAYVNKIGRESPFNVQHIEGDLPVSMPSRLQTSLMRSLRPDSDWWGDPQAARSLGKTLEKVFRGQQLRSEDWINIHALTSNKKSGISQAMIDFWAMKGPDFIQQNEHLLALEDEKKAPQPEGDDLRVDEEDINNPLGGMTTEGLDPLPAVDRLANMAPTDPGYPALQSEVQADLKKGGFVERAGSEAEYSKRVKQPGYVALREKEGEPRQLVDLGSVIQRQRARSREGLTTKQHLINAFNDMKIAGLPIDVRTLTEGVIELKDGTSAVITKQDLADLRNFSELKRAKEGAPAVPQGPVNRVGRNRRRVLAENPMDNLDPSAGPFTPTKEEEAMAWQRAEAEQEYLGDEPSANTTRREVPRGVMVTPNGEVPLAARELTTKEELEGRNETDDREPRRGAQMEAVESPPGRNTPGREGFVPDQTGLSDVNVNPKEGLKAEQVAADAERVKEIYQLAKELGVKPDDIIAVRVKKGSEVKVGEKTDAYVELREGGNRPVSVDGRLVGYNRNARTYGKGPKDLPNDMRYEHGVEVGEREINKMFPESERTPGSAMEQLHQRALDMLHDPETGIALKYHEDAVAGKYEKASVREQPADAEEAVTREGEKDSDTKLKPAKTTEGPVTEPAPVSAPSEQAVPGLSPQAKKKLEKWKEQKAAMRRAEIKASIVTSLLAPGPNYSVLDIQQQKRLLRHFKELYSEYPENRTADAALSKLMSTGQGRQQVVQYAQRSNSSSRLWRLAGSIATNHSDAVDVFNKVLEAIAAHRKLVGEIALRDFKRRQSTGHEPASTNPVFRHFFLNYQRSGEKPTVSGFAKYFLANSNAGSPRQRAMLGMMSKSKMLGTVSLVAGQDSQYSPSENTVEIGPAYHNISNLLATFIHEATHALTAYGELTDQAYAEGVHDLLSHVRSHAIKMPGADPTAFYGLSDTQEFLAEAFSNVEFQNLLRKIPALNPQKYKNAWEQFKGLIAKLFGFTNTPINNTALEEALTLGLKLGESSWNAKQAMDAKAREAYYSESLAGPIDSLNAPSTGSQPPQNGPRFQIGDMPQLIAYMRDIVPPKAKDALMGVLDRGEVHRQLKSYITKLGEQAGWDPQPFLDEMESASRGLETTLAWGYIAWHNGGLINEKGLNLFHSVEDDLAATLNLASESDFAARVFNDIDTRRIDTLRQNYDPRAIETRNRGALQAAVNGAHKALGKINKPLQAFWTSKQNRMLGANIPALNAFAALIQRPQGTTGDDPGLAPAMRAMSHTYQMRGARIVKGLSARDQIKLFDRMQRRIPRSNDGSAVDLAQEQVEKLMADAFGYAKPVLGQQLRYQKSFFPVIFNLRNQQTKDRLKALYMQPKFEQDIRDLFKALGYGPDVWDTGPIEAMVNNLVRGAERAEEPPAVTTQSNAPDFHGMQVRISDFIYKHGNADDIKNFASVQTKDPGEIFARYFEPMVKRVEYERRFGGGKRDDLFAQMRTQGATNEDIDLADNALQAALGTYGAGRSPTLAALSPSLADRFSGPKTRSAIQGLQAYQNARLLPLALLSSLVDPMGIAVRTGGDFKTAWEGFKTGMKTLTDKATRKEVEQMLSSLGSMDDMAVHELLTGRYGTDDGSPTAQKVNEFVFKYNGMAALVRTTRYMATVAAHGFLLKHADSDSAKSKRYLSELGLQPGDVQMDVVNGRKVVKTLTEAERQQATPEQKAKDDRVKNALLQFVDEAILRPNTQQTPMWHSDPYMGLVTQYRSFSYAIFDQIGSRIYKELHEGNPAVLAPALAYLPAVLFGELLREFIQWGPDGNPQRKEWGPAEYVKLATDRSGLLGPQYSILSDVSQDVRHNRLPGTSQLGPTANQMSNFYDAFHGERSLGTEAEYSIPTSAAWRHWNDDPRQAASVQETAPTPLPIG